MNKIAVASELVKLARELTAGKTFSLSHDVKTRGAEQFYTGEELEVVTWGESPRWSMRLVTKDGRKLSIPITVAHKYLKHFAKPPSQGAMEVWSDNGRAKAVDGEYTEPDGTSTSGAPSWMLVMGVI